MVMSDGGVRWIVFNLKATENTAQPSNKPFQPPQQYLSVAEGNIMNPILKILTR